MVSGFSPNLLKLFLKGDLDKMANQDDTEEPAVNPYETMRAALDDVRYDAVREVCERIGEGGMQGYTAPVAAPAEEEQGEQQEHEFVVVERESE